MHKLLSFLARKRKPLDFTIVLRKLYNNRLASFRRDPTGNAISEEEVVLGSLQRVIQLGYRYAASENDEMFLEDALTFAFLHRKMKAKSTYTYEEVVGIVRRAMSQHNDFLRSCMKQANASGRVQKGNDMEMDFMAMTGADEIKHI